MSFHLCTLLQRAQVTVTRPSMEEEVEILLSGALSNMSEQSCTPVSHRRPPHMVPNTQAASKEKAPLDLGEISPVYPKQPPPSPQESSQVGMTNVTAHSSHSPSPMWVLWRGTACPTPQSCKPTPSLCQTMCHILKRRHMTPWFTHSPPGLSRCLLAKADI